MVFLSYFQAAVAGQAGRVWCIYYDENYFA